MRSVLVILASGASGFAFTVLWYALKQRRLDREAVKTIDELMAKHKAEMAADLYTAVQGPSTGTTIRYEELGSTRGGTSA